MSIIIVHLSRRITLQQLKLSSKPSHQKYVRTKVALQMCDEMLTTITRD